MKKTNLTRREISDFFNGDNADRKFAAKRWLAQKILVEKSFNYADFYFLDCGKESTSKPADKFSICRSVLIPVLLNYIKENNAYHQAFFDFFTKAPGWYYIASELPCYQEATPKMIELLKKTVLEGDFINQTLFWKMLELLTEETSWIGEGKADILGENILNLVGLLKKSNATAAQKDIFSYFPGFQRLPADMRFAIISYALSTPSVYPEVEAAASADIADWEHAAGHMENQAATLEQLEYILSPNNAEAICKVALNWWRAPKLRDQCLALLEKAIVYCPTFFYTCLQWLSPFQNEAKTLRIVEKIIATKPKVTTQLLMLFYHYYPQYLSQLDLSAKDEDGNKIAVVFFAQLLQKEDIKAKEKKDLRRLLSELDLKKEVNAYIRLGESYDSMLSQLLDGTLSCK